MVCQYCLKNEAVYHLQKIVNNNLVEIHLCYECSRKEIQNEGENGLDDRVHRIVEGFLDSKKKVKDEGSSIICNSCGTTLQDLQKTGRVGCPDCYDTFREYIKSKLMMGNTNYSYLENENLKGSRIDFLEVELKRAVEAEDFERAAILRDKIQQCKKRFSG